MTVAERVLIDCVWVKYIFNAIYDNFLFQIALLAKAKNGGTDEILRSSELIKLIKMKSLDSLNTSQERKMLKNKGGS